MCCCCSGCSSKLNFETWDFGCVLNRWMDVMILYFKTCGIWNACDIATIHGDVDLFEFDFVCVEKIIWMQLYVLKYCIWAELCVGWIVWAELWDEKSMGKIVWSIKTYGLKYVGWKNIRAKLCGLERLYGLNWCGLEICTGCNGKKTKINNGPASNSP